MKRIDFENGTVTRNIFGAALPMLVAFARLSAYLKSAPPRGAQ